MDLTIHGTVISSTALSRDEADKILGMGLLSQSEGMEFYQMKIRGEGPWASAEPVAAAPKPAGPTRLDYDGYKKAWDGEAARTRVAEETEYLKGMGLSPADPYFDPAVGLVDWGVSNFNQSLEDWQGMMPFAESLRATADKIREEGRFDVDVNSGELSLVQDSGGLMLSRGGGKLRLTEQAMQRLFATSGAGGRIGPDWRFAKTMTADEIEHLVNSRFARLEGRNLRLRCRKNKHGEREVWGIVSQTYSDFDGDRCLSVLAEAFEGTAYRGRTLYDPNTSEVRFDGWVHAQDVSTIGPGSAFKAGISGSTRDNGGGSFRIGSSMIRNLCRNLYILDVLESERLRVAHRGTVAERVFAQTRAAVEGIVSDWEWFAARWGLTDADLATAFPETKRLLDGEPQAFEVLTLIAEGKIKIGGETLGKRLAVDRDALVEGLLGGWSLEPGEDLESIVNAVTRLHERVPVERLPALAEAGGTMLAERTMALA